jgi:hypothetical protein
MRICKVSTAEVFKGRKWVNIQEETPEFGLPSNKKSYHFALFLIENDKICRMEERGEYSNPDRTPRQHQPAPWKAHFWGTSDHSIPGRNPQTRYSSAFFVPGNSKTRFTRLLSLPALYACLN